MHQIDPLFYLIKLLVWKSMTLVRDRMMIIREMSEFLTPLTFLNGWDKVIELLQKLIQLKMLLLEIMLIIKEN